MQILPLRVQDIPAVAELEALCFSQPWSQQALADELKKPQSLLLCAHSAGQLAGYCGMQQALDEGYITSVAVHPNFRRQGVGQALVSALQQQGRQRGLAFLTLEVRESNTPAIALYTRLGFAQVGRRPGFYALPPEAALLLTYTYTGGKP